MNYHVREQNVENKSITVIFHIPINTTATNFAGKLWTECIVERFAQVPILSNNTTENALIETGQVFESAETVVFTSINLTNVQRKAEIDAAYTHRKAEILAELATTLNFWGYSADVG